MNIFKKLKNEIHALLLPVMLELPFNQKTTKPVIQKEIEEDNTADLISDEDQIKFAANAIEYNPETRKIMESYYMDDRNKPKEAYVIGIAGLKTPIKDKPTLGNKESKVKRNEVNVAENIINNVKLNN